MVVNQLFQSNVWIAQTTCVHLAHGDIQSLSTALSPGNFLCLAGATTLLLLVFVSLRYLPWHLLYSLNMRG